VAELPPELRVGPFEYTTVKRLRDEGLTQSVLSDERALELIQDASDTINEITGCVFVPLPATVRVDGRGSAIVNLPGLIPLIKVDRARMLLDSATGQMQTIDKEWYVVKERWLESVSPSATRHRRTLSDLRMWQLHAARRFTFPERPHGIEIQGVFGWVDPVLDLTLIVQAIAPIGQTFVEVDTVAAINPGFVLNLPSGERKLVGEVDYANNQLHFADKPLRAALAVDDEIKVYGGVPRLIQRAAVLIAVANKYGLACVNHQKARRGEFITFETTDNYSYAIGSGGAPGGKLGSHLGYGQTLTGSLEADGILQRFMPPTIALAV
jgi:hypothetical protein